MSAANFQSALAGLVAGEFVGENTLATLSDRDKQRYTALAPQPGVQVMRMLYFSWRLTKVLSLLPLTTKAIGDVAMARRLPVFWSNVKARSYHFVDEVLAFAEFLERDLPEDTQQQAAQVLAFEKARLLMRQSLSRGKSPEVQRFNCRFDFHALLHALETGENLTSVSRVDSVLSGRLSPDGDEEWTIAVPSVLEP
jgi:hypothetical protein